MINEIPKHEGLTPQPKVWAPQPAPTAGGVTPVTRPALGREAGPAAKPAPAEAPQLARAQVEDLAQGLQELVQTVHRQLSFKVDEDTGRTVIQVIDSTTREVVRQIPPDGILELQRRLSEIQDTASVADKGIIDGMLFNTRA